MKLLSNKKKVIKGFIIFCSFFFLADFIYKTTNNITYATREKCILYRMMPKIWFLIFEYFFELLIVVVFGTFLAVLLQSYFVKYKRFFPKNMVTAFLYASLLPVCACTTIPLVGSMKNKLRYRTIIAFIVSAPLLSPNILVLSFTVLGLKYGIIRIIAAFILALMSGIVIEFFRSTKEPDGLIAINVCNDSSCDISNPDVYLQTYDIIKKLIPYLIFAGIAGIAIELFKPTYFLSKFKIANNFTGMTLVILAGIPVYLCNGAEVLMLRPIIHNSNLALGTAIAFSLASTSVCITSIVMLTKFIGKKLTIILLANLFFTILLIGLVINLLIPKI